MNSREHNTSSVQPQRNVVSVMQLETKAQRERPPMVRVASLVSAIAGSPVSIVLHLLWFGGWIAANSGRFSGIKPFDPYPFSFLTLVVSLEAIFLTLMVLLSQNRIMSEADRRAHLDLQVNMLAEQEGTLTLRMLRKICQRLDIEDEPDTSEEKLEETTDINKLAKSLDQELSK